MIKVTLTQAEYDDELTWIEERKQQKLLDHVCDLKQSNDPKQDIMKELIAERAFHKLFNMPHIHQNFKVRDKGDFKARGIVYDIKSTDKGVLFANTEKMKHCNAFVLFLHGVDNMKEFTWAGVITSRRVPDVGKFMKAYGYTPSGYPKTDYYIVELQDLDADIKDFEKYSGLKHCETFDCETHV